ncbi:MAG: hypothetical protein SOT34_04475, partial [Candidatus Borkfalkiaceae bacterium]|nr:hypothetical protein [Christensenellaceae bacterium]
LPFSNPISVSVSRKKLLSLRHKSIGAPFIKPAYRHRLFFSIAADSVISYKIATPKPKRNG